MELTAQDVWTRVLRAAEEVIPQQSYLTWLAGTQPVGVTEDEMLVEAPSDFHVKWIEDKYGGLLEDLVQRTLGRPLRVNLKPSAVGAALTIPSLSEPPEGRGEPPARVAPAPGAGQSDVKSPLNERYTFDRFVVGTNSQLAVAACLAVAEQPARTYNPLFLYGGVGLGKTHLMHAIGNEIVRMDPTVRVAYVPSERFTNELVTSIQRGSTAQFRRRYRDMDLLLVDDVQFLEGKERTQEEFFHTFNALYDARKQIVLTSDRAPKELPGLEERLVSRFEWGLVADIKPPDYETRVAILRKKANQDGLAIEDSVLDFIARQCTSSVRELEGAVIKLLAYSSLTHREIDDDLARMALGSLARAEAERSHLSAERIREAVAAEFGVSAQSPFFETQDPQSHRPPSGSDVPDQRTSRSLAGMDRPHVRWSGSLNGHPLHPKGGAGPGQRRDVGGQDPTHSIPIGIGRHVTGSCVGPVPVTGAHQAGPAIAPQVHGLETVTGPFADDCQPVFKSWKTLGRTWGVWGDRMFPAIRPQKHVLSTPESTSHPTLDPPGGTPHLDPSATLTSTLPHTLLLLLFSCSIRGTSIAIVEMIRSHGPSWEAR